MPSLNRTVRPRTTVLALALCLALASAAFAATDDWATPAEASGFTRTPRYAETMAYFERLDAAQPVELRLQLRLAGKLLSETWAYALAPE